MASRYVEQLRAASPSGPYLLGGWSFGGVVAVEMAMQLRELGEQVPQVILLDTYAPIPGNVPVVPDEETLRKWFAWELADWSGDANFSRLDHSLLFSENGASASGYVPEAMSLEIRRGFEVFKKNARALSTYRPRIFDGKLTLLRATEPIADLPDDPARGWGGFASLGVVSYDVPGNHYSMLRRPHVQTSARLIRDFFAEDDSGSQQSV
jgi:thioesterase domain-containing protein